MDIVNQIQLSKNSLKMPHLINLLKECVFIFWSKEQVYKTIDLHQEKWAHFLSNVAEETGTEERWVIILCKIPCSKALKSLLKKEQSFPVIPHSSLIKEHITATKVACHRFEETYHILQWDWQWSKLHTEIFFRKAQPHIAKHPQERKENSQDLQKVQSRTVLTADKCATLMVVDQED